MHDRAILRGRHPGLGSVPHGLSVMDEKDEKAEKSEEICGGEGGSLIPLIPLNFTFHMELLLIARCRLCISY